MLAWLASIYYFNFMLLVSFLMLSYYGILLTTRWYTTDGHIHVSTGLASIWRLTTGFIRFNTKTRSH
jgi:hypothetical protein